MAVSEADEASVDVHWEDDRAPSPDLGEVDVPHEIGTVVEGESALSGGGATDRAEERPRWDVEVAAAGRELDNPVMDLADDHLRWEWLLQRVVAHQATKSSGEQGVSLALNWTRHHLADLHGNHVAARARLFNEQGAGDRVYSAPPLEHLPQRGINRARVTHVATMSVLGLEDQSLARLDRGHGLRLGIAEESALVTLDPPHLSSFTHDVHSSLPLPG